MPVAGGTRGRFEIKNKHNNITIIMYTLHTNDRGREGLREENIHDI